MRQAWQTKQQEAQAFYSQIVVAEQNLVAATADNTARKQQIE